MKGTCLTVLGLLAVVALTSAAQAAWVSIDDFQSYTPGTSIDGSHGWQYDPATDSTQFLAVADPTNASNQVVAATVAFTDPDAYWRVFNNSPAFAITDGSTATVFGRVMLPSANSATLDACLMGLSSSATNPHFGNTLKAYVESDGTAISARNGGSFNPDKNTWYSFWFVIHQLATGDNYDAWVQGGTGTYASPVEIATGALFRGGDTTSLQTFVIETDADVATAGTFYFDDLNVDSTGQNLASPLVPEPTTLGLLALGGIAALLRRRTR